MSVYILNPDISSYNSVSILPDMLFYPMTDAKAAYPVCVCGRGWAWVCVCGGGVGGGGG